MTDERDKDLYNNAAWELGYIKVFNRLAFLYEGFSKLLIPNWSSYGFLKESKWILPGLRVLYWEHGPIAEGSGFSNTWGLIAIGLAWYLACLPGLPACRERYCCFCTIAVTRL